MELEHHDWLRGHQHPISPHASGGKNRARSASEPAAELAHPRPAAEMNHVVTSSDPLAGRLKQAIESNELYLLYQPIVEGYTKRLVGVEALVRWQDPDIGMIPPAAFIPLAEQSDLIHALTTWTLNQALYQCREWQRMGRRVPVSVNLSPLCLQNPSLPGVVAERLKAWEISPAYLELELAEGQELEDVETAIRTLHRLRELGIRISLDNFGRGNSSLTRFKALPIDAVKIDKSFIQGVLENGADWAIVRTLIDMTQILGRKVVADGVESQELCDVLTVAGCDALQGDFAGMATPAPEFARRWFGTGSEGPHGPAPTVVGSLLAKRPIRRRKTRVESVEDPRA
jgi:EAL domain-containing protein (putative c-di-GMP-specific phosphodiesterase class I)